MLKARSRILPFQENIARYSRSPENTARGIETILQLPDQVAYQPELVKIETTTCCNLACRFCGHTWAAAATDNTAVLSESPVEDRALRRSCARAGQHMSLEVFRSILEQFPFVTRLDLQGMGEPLLNPDFPAMVTLAAERGARVQFFTNGVLLTPALALQFVEQGVAQISISLDGARAETFERIRLGAQFEHVVANIRMLIQTKRVRGAELPWIRLALVVTNLNVEEMSALVELAAELGVDEVVFTQFKAIHPDLRSWVPAPERVILQVAVSRQRAIELNLRCSVEFRVDDPTTSTQPANNQECLWPWLSVNITLNGEMTPCSYVPEPAGMELGNIFMQPFTELWNGPGYRRLRCALKTGSLVGLMCDRCRDKV